MKYLVTAHWCRDKKDVDLNAETEALQQGLALPFASIPAAVEKILLELGMEFNIDNQCFMLVAEYRGQAAVKLGLAKLRTALELDLDQETVKNIELRAAPMSREVEGLDSF